MARLYPGIYQIVNSKDGKCYIGSTAYLEKRKSQHFQSLRGGTHRNPYLQAAWNKHGEQSFSFEVLERCDREQLIEREQHYIDTLQPDYNIRKQAENNAGIARPDVQTDEGRERYREARAKADTNGRAHGGIRELSPEHQEKLRQANTGRTYTHTPEAREKMRQAKLGKKRSPESVEKSRQGHIGKKLSGEHRETIRKFQTGRQPSPESREKMRQSRLRYIESQKVIKQQPLFD